MARTSPLLTWPAYSGIQVPITVYVSLTAEDPTDAADFLAELKCQTVALAKQKARQKRYRVRVVSASLPQE